MKKYIHVVIKILLTLMLVFPVLGTLGIFPAPTRDLYNTDTAFNFINMLAETGYINWIMVIVNIIAVWALWTRREALAGILIAPVVVNIIAFHAFLDGGLFTAGAMMANVLLLLTIYLLYKNRHKYFVLLRRE